MSLKQRCLLLVKCANRIKVQGLNDILIACIDNLTMFAETIPTAFPQVEIQPYIILQILNTVEYVA
jgi:hypothetical protein